MRIVPRQGNNSNNGDQNGRIKKAKYTFYGENKKLIKEETKVYFNDNQIPTDANIDVEVNNTVKEIKIEILSAYSTTATMAELEFYGESDNWYTHVEANTAQNGHSIENAFDGDTNTIWHSKWDNNGKVNKDHPADVIITRKTTSPMSKLEYTTRKDTGSNDGGTNGNILMMSVLTSNDKQNWTEVNKVNWTSEEGKKYVDLFGDNSKYVKLHITKGHADCASAAEFNIVELTSKDQIDTSLIQTVEELGLASNNYKGWEAESSKNLISKLATAKTAKESGSINDLLNAMKELNKAYKALLPDKKPLIDKIAEAKKVDYAGKNTSSIANLKQAIKNAEKALDVVSTPLEVQFEVAQLESAMQLSSEPTKDIQNVASLTEIKRDNNFNEGWLFRESKDDAFAVKVDESQFSNINLPHDFSIDNDFTTSGEAESGFLLGGTGWYRKHVVLPKDAANKNIRLIFDGSYMDTTVYVNGKEIGQNHNGYNQFAFDITKELKCDGKTDNVIAVKVVNNLPSSRWYSGSGIYRDVTLQVTDKTHIDYLGSFVATPEGNKVEIKNTVVGKNKDTKIQTTILDKDGKEVAKSNLETVNNDVMTTNLNVANPTLWSTENPYLYKAVTRVYNGNTEVDKVENKFGFKTIVFDRDKGLTLNGKIIKLKGVCMHHDQGALGAASNYHAVYRQMKIMKDMGVNAIRVTHNPSSEMLLDICDELGLLVINEAFDHLYYSKNNNNNDFARWFKQPIGNNGPVGSTSTMTWAEFVAKQMVKVSRNHASVLMYSVGNELLEGGGSDQGYVQTVESICDWFKEMDPYHKPTIGDNKAKGNDRLAVQLCDAVAKKGGIVGFNYANPDQYNNLRNSHKDWILYGSETSSAFHSRDVYNTDFKDESRLLCTDYENETSRAGWGHSASTAWKYVEENNWNIGEFVWTGFDYIGEPTPWNGIGTGSQTGGKAAPRSSFFGIVETTGFAKDIYYLYQSLWNDQVHTLHMTERWNDDMLKHGENVLVQVFSDADKIELYLNDQKIDERTSTVKENGTRKFGDKYFAEFNVKFKPGKLSVKAFDKDGKEIKDTVGRKEVSTTSKATKTSLSANKQTIESDGYDLSYITVDVVDKDNHFVSNNNQKLYFTLEGEGRIVGVDNGNQSDTQSFRVDDPKRASRNSFNGKALVIVQSTKRAGNIKLHVKGVGLEDNAITIQSKSSSTSDRLSAVELVSKYSTFTNKMVNLPKTVTGIFENGQVKELPVKWDTSKLDIKRVGIYTVTGSIDGYDAKPIITVNVYNEFGGVQNYSTVMNEGMVISLPETRKVYYADGTVAGSFPVVWNYFDSTDLKAGKTYTVNGTINVADKQLAVKANIRVEKKLPESKNIARLESDMPKLAQSCKHTADNLNSLNNGVKVSTDPNQRWTDYNEQNQVKPWVSYTWKNKYTVSDIIAYIYQDHASTVPREMELEVETLNDKGEWVKQEISYITPVAYNDGDGKTTINLKKPVTTNGIKLHINKKKASSFTGLTELEVFEYVPKEQAKQDTTIKNLTLNGKKVENFTPENEMYEIQVEKFPNMESVNVKFDMDQTATSVVLKDENSHTIRIIVTAENGSEKTYTIQYAENQSSLKDELNTTIQNAENKLNTVTVSSSKNLKDAIAKAKKVLKNGSSSEIQAMIKELTDEMNSKNLVNRGNVNELSKVIEANKDRQKADYEVTNEQWNAFTKALHNAMQIVKDNSNQSQADVDAAKAELEKAIAVLDENKKVTDSTTPNTGESGKPGNSDSNKPGKPNNKVETGETPTTAAATQSALLWVVFIGAGVAVLVVLRNRKKSKA